MLNFKTPMRFMHMEIGLAALIIVFTGAPSTLAEPAKTPTPTQTISTTASASSSGGKMKLFATAVVTLRQNETKATEQAATNKDKASNAAPPPPILVGGTIDFYCGTTTTTTAAYIQGSVKVVGRWV